MLLPKKDVVAAPKPRAHCTTPVLQFSLATNRSLEPLPVSDTPLPKDTVAPPVMPEPTTYTLPSASTLTPWPTRVLEAAPKWNAQGTTEPPTDAVVGAAVVLPEGAPVVLPDGAPVVLPEGAPVVLPEGAPVVVPEGAPVVLPEGAPVEGGEAVGLAVEGT